MNVVRQNNSVLTKGNTNLITVNRIGNGLKFDGVNDFVSLPDISYFTTNSPFTVSCIFKCFNDLSGNTVPIYCVKNAGFNGGRLFAAGSNTVAFLFFSTSELARWDFDYTSLIGQTLHTTIVWSGSSFTGYVNGVLAGVSSGSHSAFINTLINSPTRMGIDPSVIYNYFPSSIYDFKIFNTNISAGQVTQLYNSSNMDLTGLTPNVLADYNFNQKLGTQLTDNSPNQLHGTLTNFGATSNLGGGAWVNSLGSTITY